MRGIRIIEIENVDIFRAVWKCYEDYKRKLILLPASLSGNYHPVDERGVGGIVKHIEKVCWFILKYSEEFNIPKKEKDILMACGFFHDIGTVEVTDIKLQIEILDSQIVRKHLINRDESKYLKHPEISAEIARKYLEREKVDPKTIEIICNIIKSHMSHWLPGNLPLPKTDLEKIFALADFIMAQPVLELNI